MPDNNNNATLLQGIYNGITRKLDEVRDALRTELQASSAQQTSSYEEIGEMIRQKMEAMNQEFAFLAQQSGAIYESNHRDAEATQTAVADVIAKKIDELSARFDKVEEQLGKLDEGVKAIDERIGEVREELLEALDASTQAIQGELTPDEPEEEVPAEETEETAEEGFDYDVLAEKIASILPETDYDLLADKVVAALPESELETLAEKVIAAMPVIDENSLAEKVAENVPVLDYDLLAEHVVDALFTEEEEPAEEETAETEGTEEEVPEEEPEEEEEPIVIELDYERIATRVVELLEEKKAAEPAPVEEEPAPAEEPAEEPAPVEEEPAPAEEPAEEPAPAVDEAAIAARVVDLLKEEGLFVAVVEETPAEEPAPVEEEPVEEPAPVEEEPVEEPAPVEEEPVEEPAPVEEEPVEEPAPVEEEPVEEPAPVEEEPVEEPAPVEEEPVEEPAPVEEEPVEEPAPVEEEPVEEPAPVEEEPVEEPAPTVVVEELAAAAEPEAVVEEDNLTTRLKRSFTAKIIESDEEVKDYYSTLKNALLSYARVTSQLNWSNDRFAYANDTIAKIGVRGRTLCLYLALNPEEFPESVYHQKFAGDTKMYEKTPLMMKVKSRIAVKRSLRLIELLAERLGTVQDPEFVPVDYVPEFAFRSEEELLREGLIKTSITEKSDLNF